MSQGDPNQLLHDLTTAKLIPDIRAVLRSIVNAFGGEEQLGEEIVENLHVTEMGSAQRTQGYNGIMAALQKFTPTGDEEDLGDEESIRAMLRQEIQNAKTHGEGGDDGS